MQSLRILAAIMVVTCSALFNRIENVYDEKKMNIMEMVRFHGY